MGFAGNGSWDADKEVYSPSQVEAVLRALNISVQDETFNDFVSFCPYHGNTDTPAFSTSRTYGYSICFNPACGKGSEERLSLEQLVKDLKGFNAFEAKRFIIKNRDNTSFEDKFDAIQFDSEELKEFPPVAINKMESRFWETPAAIDYMHGRGFTDETLKEFHVGFTPAAQKPIYRAQDMVVVPAYDHRSHPVGLVGRSIEGKVFKNYGPEEGGKGFHKSKIIWNLNKARRHESIILTEATFDSMRVHQAGFPNVGALLGGTLSNAQVDLLKRHFSSIIIMTDNETGDNVIHHQHCAKCLRMKFSMCQGHQPGRDLGMKIVESLPNMRIKWAVYDEKYVYANNVKDAAGMTDDQISQCLRNAISHYDYLEMVA